MTISPSISRLHSPFLCCPLKISSFSPLSGRLSRNQRSPASYPCIRADLDQNTIVAISVGVVSVAVGIGVPIFYETQIDSAAKRENTQPCFPCNGSGARVSMMHLAAAGLKKKKDAEGQFHQSKKRKVQGEQSVEQGTKGVLAIAVTRKKGTTSTASAQPSASARKPSLLSREAAPARSKSTPKRPAGSGKSVRDLVNVYGEDVLERGLTIVAEPTEVPLAPSILSQTRVVSTGAAEEFFLNSVPPAEATFSGTLGDDALEQRFVQGQLEAYFAGAEMVQRWKQSREENRSAVDRRNQAEAEVKKIQAELENLKGENVELTALKLKAEAQVVEVEIKAVQQEKAAKEWETKYWAEHECRSNWEVEAKSLMEKYEDDQGNLKLGVQNVVVDDFLVSDRCKNLIGRLGVQTCRQVFQTALGCIREKDPSFVFPEDHQAFLETGAPVKTYVLPWEEGFNRDEYFKPYPSPEVEEDEEIGENEGTLEAAEATPEDVDPNFPIEGSRPVAEDAPPAPTE